MKSVNRFAALALMLCVVSAFGFSQATSTEKPPTTVTQNLVRGVIGPVSSNNSWANYSVMNIVPGATLFPLSSTTTVFYWAFTAGTQADISNMVVYTTVRGSLTVSAVTPVTLGGLSNPSIVLSSTSVCPVQPLSAATPCVIRFDPTTLSMTPANDYYLIVYYANDTNNSGIGGAEANFSQTSLVGNYFGGTDYTKIKVGQALPGGGNRGPNFLMYVMNN